MLKSTEEIYEYPIKGEIYSVERLEEYAAYLADQLKISENPKISHPLLPRMKENGARLLDTYRALTDALHRKDSLPPAAEWLTDNFFIVEDQLREIQEDLPPAYYKELPKIAMGELTGYPRIYALALALIAHTDSQLEPDTIRRFIRSYQKISSLTIGELWALPITLRLVLVENLRRIAVRIVRDHEKRNAANKFADLLFENVNDKAKFQDLVNELPTYSEKKIEDDCSFMAQIAKRLRDQEPELWPALEFLEKNLGKKQTSSEQIVHMSHQMQAANQVSVANVITSMRLLSSLNWREFFESLSLVDRVLEKDPVYSKMDFITRDRYRHVIERIAKRTRVPETEVAQRVVDLALGSRDAHPDDFRRAHVGYYLIGKGLKEFEKKFNFRLQIRAAQVALSHQNMIYFGCGFLFLALIMAIPLLYAAHHASSYPSGESASLRYLIGIAALLLVPCSELALNLTNLLITHLVRPKILPKLDMSLGVPTEGRTMVVISCLLSNARVVQDLIEKIEIHYLGNSDPQIYFGLLTDFTDGKTEVLPEDGDLLGAVSEGIKKLNLKYPEKETPRFHLFNRRRQWNTSENVWMGWERKRGKINEFNRLLRGAQNTSFTTMTADAAFLKTIRFVITLDMDTQLPRETARKMVGTILHPLNQPLFDKATGRVVEGYGVLQPRIGISLESSTRSYFAKIFSGYTGIDPYTTAVSDVYQDLYHEGSYTGKGLYDVDAFEAALENRVRENQILSHDLFEGLHARAGLLTDVELLDDYPQTYFSFFTRQHRWVRGDWQIAAWVTPFVRNAQNALVRNRLPAISKWKIFDNLRRSLVAPLSLLWYVLAWTYFPGNPLFWAGYGIALILTPVFAQSFLATMLALFRKGPTRLFSRETKTHIDLLQCGLYFVFLAHQAYIQLDAIVRVMFRQLISKKKLLEWATAAHVESQYGKIKRPFWQTAWPLEISLVAGAFFLFYLRLPLPGLGLAFILLWMLQPPIARLISARIVHNTTHIDQDNQEFLRQIARRTWHYFESFVGVEDNWLPPDNHQVFPRPLTAHRTSPTNIGLYLLSLASARDLGFLNSTKFVELTDMTLNSLKKMEQYQGHYYNWYDTKTLEPLNPKYVSTVDSGNLAGYFLATKQICAQVPKFAVIENSFVTGLRNSFAVLETEVRELKGRPHGLIAEIHHARDLLLPPATDTFTGWAQAIKKWTYAIEGIKTSLLKIKNDSVNNDIESVFGWANSVDLQIKRTRDDLEAFAPWLREEFMVLDQKFLAFSDELSKKWREVKKDLDRNMSFRSLRHQYDASIELVAEIGEKVKTIENKTPADREDISQRLEQFSEALNAAEGVIDRLFAQSSGCAQFMDDKFKAMNFAFLLDKDRQVFSIGYSVSDGKMDRGLYDLLGSESRVASFVAIAKGEVPQEHWFKLGRQLVPIGGDRALISWTASMFEYLMPLLIMRDYENTLLYETVRSVVQRQIRYGNEHHVPWGVSEAGYNARDLQLNYQYGPFGVPGLGLKRGLSHDLVISPYSTCLAAMVNSEAALENLRRLTEEEKLLTRYGFYESVDYTPERLQEHQKCAVIRSFMAHHQGMSLVAINNVINNNIIQNYFHSDPRVKATQMLLQERIPQGVTPILPKAAELEIEGAPQAAINPFIRHYTDPNTSTPNLQLLSNRSYSIMISSAGGGYSKCNGLAVTRWKEDPTRDHWGSFIFVRDLAQKNLWSTTYQPLTKSPSSSHSHSYKVTFGEEKVEFRRRDGDISSYTQILVAPEDNVEIRHVTLTNHSSRARDIELTSYLEPVLTQLAADSSHPAFSKLFIQTEFLASKNAILAKRRARSAQEKEIWGLHVVVTNGELLSEVQYETDREKFMGRGRHISNAEALREGANLTNSVGATLDPVMSLRARVKVPANGKVQVAFTTGMAMSRDEALELADRYHDIHSFERESKIAWTKSQVDMRHLNIDSETASLYQRLAERIIYTEPSLKPPAHKRAANTNLQSSLWPSGISGDLPIVVVRIGDQKDVGTIRRLLRCHEYLRLKGLVYDFVILNDHETTYLQGLQEDINQQIRTTGSQGWLNRPGGIYMLRTDLMPEKDIAHMMSVARVTLAADEPFKEQINRKALEEKYPPTKAFVTTPKVDPNPLVPVPDLDFFNGLGGFGQKGKEFVTVLRENQWAPAPWLNVIGNARGFGFQVSEVGSGFTWNLNSQTNRLTPWSNDWVSDPPGEIIYLRDDETGEIWTPTPLPIREEAPYTIKHGQGYTTFDYTNHGIQHSLNLFVPKNDPVKISFLTLKNLTARKRKLTVVNYTEWVLGAQREKSSAHLVCDFDAKTSSVLTRNPHDNEYATLVSFASISAEKPSFTCSRKEFLGRNGNYLKPAALLRVGLSGKSATGQDPCTVLQTSFELVPGEQKEFSFLLGQAENAETARAIAARYKDAKIVKEAFRDVMNSWSQLQGRLQVKTPDPTMDILLNHWLFYQTLSCRYWSRTAFYQSGGAYGFRDQLQDCMAFAYVAPEITKEHILRASEHQFKEGDVQHWWHPPTGRGIRTRMSDDLLWLPYVISFYIKTTGDRSILDEKTAFIEAPLLKPEEEDSYTLPAISKEKVSLFEHCVRAIDRSLTLGQHGLPLMGTGDWNDGMNRVGFEGKGESIWLGWFLYRVLEDFLPFCQAPEHASLKEKYSAHMERLKEALEKDGWDGEWYKRAYFDDGSPLGSQTNDECKIDSLAQTWAVISGAGDHSRSVQAMQKVDEFLVTKKSNLVLLFTPPFDHSKHDPGYIKGYLPGVRENGGQYTHASTWVMKAFAELGDGNKAYEIFTKLNPIRHSLDSKAYRIEPYVIAGDVYGGNGALEGRGGWSWYTGSSSWYYRVVIESLLGFQLQGQKIQMNPCIPATWKEFEIAYTYGSSKYMITVKNPKGLTGGPLTTEQNGNLTPGGEIQLVDDGKTHNVTVTLQFSPPEERSKPLYSGQSEL